MIDMEKLKQTAETMSCSIQAVEHVIGRTITPDMDGDDRRLIWEVMRDPGARGHLLRIRRFFPDAVITRIVRK